MDCSGLATHEASESTPISRIIAEVATRFPDERISIGELTELFGERAFGLLILLLCLPSLLPGMATVIGAPMLILAVQMGLGLRNPRLPGFMRRRTIRRTDLLRLSSASSGLLRRAERWVRPRPGYFVSAAGERLVGWLSAYAALMIMLPGPMTNGPPAFGTIVMCLGLVEQDNRMICLGALLTLLGSIFSTVMLALIGWSGMQALGWLF